MEMLLFLNESYIFHRFRMWSIVLWHSCVFVCAECGNANYRGAGVPWKTLLRAPVKFPLPVKKNIRILDLDPCSEAYCLSLNSVCFKRLPRKKYFHLLKSVQDIRRVFGVVYCWRLQICEFSANALVQLRNCSRWRRMVLREVDVQSIVYDKNRIVTSS